MAQQQANGIAIEVETRGPADGSPLLLIRGLGTQLIQWPERLLGRFEEAGFRTILFDNRDAGLSQRFDGLGMPDLERMRARLQQGLGPEAPYLLSDMADDAVGVLDALGVPAAHMLGISLGGMILQVLATRHPGRVLSAAIGMSSSGAPDLPSRTPEMSALLFAQPDDPQDRAQAIEHALSIDRAFAGSGFPFDEAERRALIGRLLDRARNPDGALRQMAALIASPPRHEAVADITAPTLVFHGADDPLLQLEHGRDLAARIPGAEWLEIAGMGHEIEGEACDIVAEAMARLAKRAEKGG